MNDKGENTLLKFTIPLAPVTKKNSQQIRYRYVRDKRTGKPKRAPYIAPSEAYINYENAALWFVPKGKTINVPVNVKCLFYMPDRRKCDLTNLEEAVDDILVKAGLLADDNYTIVESHDGSRVLYDKDNPRTEIHITPAYDWIALQEFINKEIINKYFNLPKNYETRGNKK